MISPLNFRAIRTAKSDLPEEVGPRMTRSLYELFFVDILIGCDNVKINLLSEGSYMPNQACSPRNVFFRWNDEISNLLDGIIKYINGVAEQIEPHKHFEPILIDLMVYREKVEKLDAKKRILFFEALEAEYISSGWKNVEVASRTWQEERGRFFLGIKLSA